MMLHMEKSDMLMLVAEIEVGDKTANYVDKLACAVNVVKPKQRSVRHSIDHSSSDSSSRHSSSDHSSPNLPSTSAGPSHKRRRSLITSVPTLALVSEAFSLVRADLIPPPKRVRDIGYLADVEREHGHRIVGVGSAVTALTERKIPNTRPEASMTHEEVEELVARRVAEEMEAREVARNLKTLSESEEEQEGQSREVYWRVIGYIQGNVIAANPARLQDAICFANQLMDKKLQGYAARSAENKSRMESNPRDNCG
nr:hypothetical protein [Tanacetum cinerariifolium]